jgi:hypothetical protein
LRQAAGLVEKRFEATELERWVWWCYPVFRRYGWNVREVLEAASRRGMNFEAEKDGIDRLIAFQKYWIRCGLRFAGGKHKAESTPPLREFVCRIVLPEEKKMWGDYYSFRKKNAKSERIGSRACAESCFERHDLWTRKKMVLLMN